MIEDDNNESRRSTNRLYSPMGGSSSALQNRQNYTHPENATTMTTAMRRTGSRSSSYHQWKAQEDEWYYFHRGNVYQEQYPREVRVSSRYDVDDHLHDVLRSRYNMQPDTINGTAFSYHSTPYRTSTTTYRPPETADVSYQEAPQHYYHQYPHHTTEHEPYPRFYFPEVSPLPVGATNINTSHEDVDYRTTRNKKINDEYDSTQTKDGTCSETAIVIKETATTTSSSLPLSSHNDGDGSGLGFSVTQHPPVYNRDIHPHDVLFGRGGAANSHEGNRYFRKLVNKYRQLYKTSRKRDKAQIAFDILQQIQSRIPPGRFLKRCSAHDHLWWMNVGTKRALLKTSQALREVATQTGSNSTMTTLRKNTKKTTISNKKTLKSTTSNAVKQGDELASVVPIATIQNAFSDPMPQHKDSFDRRQPLVNLINLPPHSSTSPITVGGAALKHHANAPGKKSNPSVPTITTDMMMSSPFASSFQIYDFQTPRDDEAAGISPFISSENNRHHHQHFSPLLSSTAFLESPPSEDDGKCAVATNHKNDFYNGP